MSRDRARPGAGAGAVPRWVFERRLPGRRLFVAVPLSQDVRDDVIALVDRVRASVGGSAGDGVAAAREVRWVRMDGLHLTLRFLGPTLDDRIPAIEGAMRGAAESVGPFPVRIAGGGAFPDPRRPRVLWIGVTDGGDRLRSVAGILEDGLVAAGWPRDERAFRAHLTLARSDGVRSGPETARALIAAAERFTAGWTAESLILVESHTGTGPARYEALREVRFSG